MTKKRYPTLDALLKDFQWCYTLKNGFSTQDTAKELRELYAERDALEAKLQEIENKNNHLAKDI